MPRSDGNAELIIQIAAGSTAADRLSAVLDANEVASVLIMPCSARPLAAEDAHPLVELAQGHGAAALIMANPVLARAVAADGLHLPASEEPVVAYRAARELLGPRMIIGADPGALRHNAMVLGEEGADYVGFGLPTGSADGTSDREARLELVAWWAEIFEIPCVGLDVTDVADAQKLAMAGADFIGVLMPPEETPAAVATRIRMLSQALGISDFE